MQAVITVIGKDKVGILAEVCTSCAKANVNVEEVSQRILGGMFAMIMIVDIEKSTADFTEFAKGMTALGEKLGVDIHCKLKAMYDAMHRI